MVDQGNFISKFERNLALFEKCVGETPLRKEEGRKVPSWIPNGKDEIKRGSKTESRPTRTTESGKEVVAMRTSYAERIDNLVEAMASMGGSCALPDHYNTRSVIIIDDKYFYTPL